MLTLSNGLCCGKVEMSYSGKVKMSYSFILKAPLVAVKMIFLRTSWQSSPVTNAFMSFMIRRAFAGALMQVPVTFEQLYYIALHK